MTSDRNNDKTWINLLLLQQSRDLIDGDNTPILQKAQLLKFYWLYFFR